MNLKRPNTLKEAVDYTNMGASFRHMVAEFLDSYYLSSEENKEHFFSEEPPLLNKNNPDYNDWQDSYLAAIAEHLLLMSNSKKLPEWIKKEERFLKKAVFMNQGLTSLNAMLLAESPLAFRRRMIFTEQKPLRRASQMANK